MEKKNFDAEVVERLTFLEEKVERSRKAIEEKQRMLAINNHENTLWNHEKFWNVHYANSCIVCHSTARVDSCNRCKMIFYCGEKHRKKHWPEHKDLCKVILGMLKETGATTLFDNLKTNDSESWMRTKIDLMLKAESKLGVPLMNYEREMFLFPKTCIFCHESDLSVLKSCDCGVSLCKQHKKDEGHQKLCHKFRESFTLAVEMKDIKPYPLLIMEAEEIMKPIESLATIPVHTEVTSLPNSMKMFLQTYMKLKGEAAWEVKARTYHRTPIFSEFISRPLTLLYAIQKLNLMSSSTLLIHVIGATYNEFVLGEYWEIILHWLPALKLLEVVYVGPELDDTYSNYISVCSSCKSRKKYINSSGVALTYEDYFRNKIPNLTKFKTPNIVIGYNLDLHENELGITNWNWKDAFLTLKNVNAPFILTAGSEERAKKDHEVLCKLLEKPVSHILCEPNPFAGLIPERDFETEELLRYTNKHIIIYKTFYEELTESSEVNKESVEKKGTYITVAELEKQIEAEEKKQSEIFQLKGKQNEIAVTELKKESEPQDKKEPDVFQPNGKAVAILEVEGEKLKIQSSSSVENKPVEEDLLKENLLLKQENILLKENYLLKKENIELKSENEKLKQENERLQAENQLIKDLRSQVQESIKAAMCEKL